jgi:hypothetical protein
MRRSPGIPERTMRNGADLDRIGHQKLTRAGHISADELVA